MRCAAVHSLGLADRVVSVRASMLAEVDYVRTPLDTHIYGLLGTAQLSALTLQFLYSSTSRYGTVHISLGSSSAFEPSVAPFSFVLVWHSVRIRAFSQELVH
jgi:hypothetical protein